MCHTCVIIRVPKSVIMACSSPIYAVHWAGDDLAPIKRLSRKAVMVMDRKTYDMLPEKLTAKKKRTFVVIDNDGLDFNLDAFQFRSFADVQRYFRDCAIAVFSPALPDYIVPTETLHMV